LDRVIRAQIVMVCTASLQDTAARPIVVMENAMSTQPDSTRSPIITVPAMSNREFLETYAGAGRLGLSGGVTLVDRAISRAERHVDGQGHWSLWSHAFVFEGRRQDGEHWVMESDLQFKRKHIRLGVQENRIAKYFDEKLYRSLAVLDFGLTANQVTLLLREGLELVANQTRYSFRELVGTLIALRHSDLRSRDNVLARDSSFYCSAFVRHLFHRAGVDLAPGVDPKNTTPEDLARTLLPHTTYVLSREAASSRLTGLARRVRQRIRAKLERARRGIRRKNAS